MCALLDADTMTHVARSEGSIMLSKRARGTVALMVCVGLVSLLGHSRPSRADVTSEAVEKAVRDGMAFLLAKQNGNGSWDGNPGTTELVTLALLTAGQTPDSPKVRRAIQYSLASRPEDLNNTYAIALQTMVMAAADPRRYQDRIARNAQWLVEAQQVSVGGRNARGFAAVGSWSYTINQAQHGDNSNTQYALLGLHAAGEAGIEIPAPVWMAARRYWVSCQQADGGWQYQPAPGASTGSMTTAGISSLVISGLGLFHGREELRGDSIHNCGQESVNIPLQRAVNWLGMNFQTNQNINAGMQWKHYYLYGLERAGRLAGLRYFGRHDWYREGADELVQTQNRGTGGWQGDDSEIHATAFALLFLAKGRAPVLINKVRHAPAADWENDPDDVRNLVDVVSRDWKHLLTWQVVDPEFASVPDLLQAPVIFLNGHKAPVFSHQARQKLRDYVEQGGFIFADACCGRAEFDAGFRELMKQVFPEPEYSLKPLLDEHPIWRAHYDVLPETQRLEGIEFGCRTVVVYSPDDLSCYWNHLTTQPANPAVIKARRVGQNVIDYATGREMPADKLQPRVVAAPKLEQPKRGALQIAKLRHAGDWNIAPMAVPHLTSALRERRGFDVVINHREILPSDANLANFPLLYIHGRAALSFSKEDLAALRRHIEPGGGTIFADAACGSPAFDAAFRRFAKELLPRNVLEPIPPEDELYTLGVGFDLSDVEYSRAAGGKKGKPQLEGIKINGHWAIIYSKYDIGCALERPQGVECKGYTHESAIRIATNIVIYATLP
jgi:hypothetical protein